MNGMDSVINSTWYPFNLDIMKAAMKARVNTLDLGGLYHMTLRQLELDKEARDTGTTFVLGCGEDPGLSNVFARSGADKMDTVDSIKIRDGDRDLIPSALFKFSIRTIVGEWTEDAFIFRNGKLERIPALSEHDRVRMPKPIGEVDCYATIHSELATLPQYIGKGVKYVDFMVSEAYEMVSTLKKLGFLDSEPLRVGDIEIKPVDFTTMRLSKFQADPVALREMRDVTCVMVEVTGSKGPSKLQYTAYAMCHSQPQWEALAMDYLTGICPSIGAQILAKDRSTVGGVYPPEAYFRPSEFIDAVRARRVTVKETTRIIKSKRKTTRGRSRSRRS
jgi:saccharopine dehydrogenase (NAD+, L-lysine-forming)